MSKLEQKVNEILGIEKEVEKVEKEFKPLVPRKEDKQKEDVDNDYKYSRENYYNLIERGQEAIQGILDVAKEGQHPRAYEVALAGIKNVADTVDKLQDLQAKLKELKQLVAGVSSNSIVMLSCINASILDTNLKTWSNDDLFTLGSAK